MRREAICWIIFLLLAAVACETDPGGPERCQWWIEGFVTSTADGASVEDVTVSAQRSVTYDCSNIWSGCKTGYNDVAVTTTDATGHYGLGVYECGVSEVRLKATKEDRSSCSMPVAIRSEDAQRVDLVLCP